MAALTVPIGSSAVSLACAAVLDNAARHAEAIAGRANCQRNCQGKIFASMIPETYTARVHAAAVGPPGLLAQPSSSRAPSKGNSSLRLAAAMVVQNALRHADALRWASDTSGRGGGASAGPAPVDGGGSNKSPVQQHPLPAVMMTGGNLRWRPDQVQALARHVSSLPAGARINVLRAAKALGYELWMADGRACSRLRVKLKVIRRQLDHGRDPMADHDPATQVPYGTYNWGAWLRRAFRALPDQTGTVTDLAVVLEADPDIAPRLDRRLDPACRNTPMWKRSITWEVKRKPEFVNTGRRIGYGVKGGWQVVYRLDEEVARLQLQQRPRAPRKRGVPGLPLLGKKYK